MNSSYRMSAEWVAESVELKHCSECDAGSRGWCLNFLTQWPMERPQNWIEFVNAPDNASELDDLRSSAPRGRPFGNEDWVMIIAKRLGLESTMKSRGRPKRT